MFNNYNNFYKDADNESSSDYSVNIDWHSLISYKIKQFIGYGVHINNMHLPKSYFEVLGLTDETADAIDKLVKGKDENLHFWIEVPLSSEYTELDGTIIAGDYLAKKFKKEMHNMTIIHFNDEMKEALKEMDILNVKVMYKIRNEHWTKKEGEYLKKIYSQTKNGGVF